MDLIEELCRAALLANNNDPDTLVCYPEFPYNAIPNWKTVIPDAIAFKAMFEVMQKLTAIDKL